MKYKNIGVMCGSSDACSKEYHDMAYELGKYLAIHNHKVVYGGGSKGLMKRVADGALDHEGKVWGYMPKFMIDVEWQHPNLTKLITTEDMSTRIELMKAESDATIFLPGGSGTMEEFFVWLCAKRLGHYTGPLILVNFKGYYDELLILLDKMEKEKFHNPVHSKMYSVVTEINNLHEVLDDAYEWSKDAIKFAAVEK